MDKLTLEQQKDITIDDLSVVILKVLRQGASPPVVRSHEVGIHWILEQAAEATAPGGICDPEFRGKAYEAVHKLMTKNLIMEDPFYPPTNLIKGKDKKIRLTQRGIEADVSGEIVWDITPAKDYIKTVRKKCGKLDKIAEIYLEESYRSCQNKFVLSSAFLLGAVCERLVLLLADHLEKILKLSNLKYFRNNMIRISDTQKAIEKLLDELKNKYGNDKNKKRQINSTKRHLDGLFAIYKECRDDVGHPDDNKPDITLPRQQAHLLAFPDFAQSIYKILKIQRVP